MGFGFYPGYTLEGEKLLEHFTTSKKPIIIDWQIIDWEDTENPASNEDQADDGIRDGDEKHDSMS